MRQLTIAEWRQKEVQTLHARNMDAPIEDARKALNSYYRYCALNERIFNIENDEYLYNRYTKNGGLDRLNSKLETWRARLNGYLKPFNASVANFGIYPSIVRYDNYCIAETVIYGHFYN